MDLKNLKKLFYKDVSYSLKSIYKGHHQITYRGVKCIKCPFDYVLYQMILNEVKPDLIIEIGTNQGGSTLYLADLLEILGNGLIHSIDITDTCPPIVKQHARIKLFHQGWDSYDMEFAKGFEKVLVIEDSSHHYENTLSAIRKFEGLVSKNSYLIVEDGIIDALGWSKDFEGGPVKAINEFLSENNNFVRDSHWEDFFGKSATFNTKGFLKKVK